MAGLVISHLSKSFGATPVLSGVSLAVESGSLIAILGASGSGKTTLLRLIAGFEKPDSGTIKLEGEDITNQRPEHRGIGYVAQDGALFPHLCVADNITFGLKRAERRARHRVAELLEMVDLPRFYADRAPQQLSGGEQQRIALARALAPGPKFLLLDEPFSALDVALREDTRSVVAAAIRAAGASAILVTHDQAEALSMGSLVGVLQHGRLAQMSPPESLYRHPASADLANFVGDAIFCPGIAGNGIVHCALGDLALDGKAATGPVEIMIRPEQIKITTQPAAGSVAAAIRKVIFYGHDTVVTLDLADAQAAQPVTARVFSQTVPKPGSQVWLNVDGPVIAYPAAPSQPEPAAA